MSTRFRDALFFSAMMMVCFLPGGAVLSRYGYVRAPGGIPFDTQRTANHAGAGLHDTQTHAF